MSALQMSLLAAACVADVLAAAVVVHCVFISTYNKLIYLLLLLFLLLLSYSMQKRAQYGCVFFLLIHPSFNR